MLSSHGLAITFGRGSHPLLELSVEVVHTGEADTLCDFIAAQRRETKQFLGGLETEVLLVSQRGDAEGLLEDAKQVALRAMTH